MTKFFRKVIRIRAEDSPNVRYALAEKQSGREPTGETLLDGVIGWGEYLKRRATWDKVRQSIGLDAEFPRDGAHLLLPPDWLNRAEAIYDTLRGTDRRAVAMGIDPAEGGDKTAWAVIDERGLIELVSKQTADTATIIGETLALMNKHHLKPEMVCFDRGGGGQQHADNLRSKGYRVKAVGFGEAPVPEPWRRRTLLQERIEQQRERYAYKNRRAQMYWYIRELLDPAETPNGFGLPAEEIELRRQLAPMPLLYDDEGQIYMLPKNKRDSKDTRECLSDILGRSPDEADALALAVWTWKNARNPITLRVMY